MVVPRPSLIPSYTFGFFLSVFPDDSLIFSRVPSFARISNKDAGGPLPPEGTHSFVPEKEEYSKFWI